MYFDFPNLTVRGRLQLCLHALYQAQAGIQVEPQTFRKVAGYIHMKGSEIPGGIRTHSGDDQVIWSQSY